MENFLARCFAILVTGFFIFPQECFAGSVTLTLREISGPTSENVIEDTSGSTWHEGGTILKGSTEVGYYQMTRRVNNYNELNISTVELVLMFWKSGGLRPPENVWIQGVHYFGSGMIRGAVSSSSKLYKWLNGASAIATYINGTTTTPSQFSLVLSWDGGVTLP